MSKITNAVVVLALIIAGVALKPAASWIIEPDVASKDTCSDRFPGGQRPLTPNVMSEKSIFICNDAAAILYSPKTRTAIYSAEHLQPWRIAKARSMIRNSKFHDDPATGSDGPRLDDYRKSSYDRGHLAPSGDQPTEIIQFYSLANIVPQNADNNRHLWANIEEAVRDYVSSNNEVYVVTGPLFDGGSIGFIHGRVAIPTRLFKAVLDPSTRHGGVYIAWNQPGNAYGVVSFAAFQRMTGIDLFPALEAKAKNAAPELPLPTHGDPKKIPEAEE